MAKKNYDQMAAEIIEKVGGKDNISLCFHCITRLRFNVKDMSLIETEEIKKIPGVLDAQVVGDQFQVIIGQDVAKVYDVVCTVADIAKQEAVNENLDNGAKKKFTFMTLIDAITGCIVPVLPIMLGVGLLKAVLIILSMLHILDNTGSTYAVLSFVADAGFYFMPVYVGSTAAKKFGGNPALGMLMGAMLLSPTFIAKVGAGEAMTIFGLPIYNASYANSFFSTIIIVFVMSQIEKVLKKYVPQMVSSIVVPLGVILIMTPLNFVVLGPLGSYIGIYLSKAVILLYETIGFVGVALLAAIRPILVMTGMHTAFTPYLLQSLSSLGYEAFYSPASFIANMNQGAACLGVALKSKNSSVRSTALSSGITAYIGGVTEPAMYAINLKYKTPMIASMIGSAVGGLYAGLMHVGMYSLSTGSILGIVAYVSDNPMNLVHMAIGLGIGTVVTVALSFIMYKDDPAEMEG